jgi:alpha-methylacyl-CoA racemase
MTSPLSGILVVDLSRLLPGPLAAKLLADLGARVVKVEEPSLGDPIRMLRQGVGSLGTLLLSGIESVALDLKQPAAREILERLLDRADVLVESFRPGTLARLGFPIEEVRERYPRLVICSLSGWGQQGPYAARAGHDLTYLAAAGALASTVAMPPVQVADLIGAWSAVVSILAALLERERTRRGRHIDASLYDAALHTNLVGWTVDAAAPRRVGDRLPLTGALPCYNVYETADGRHLAIGALEPHFWRRFCLAAGREDLIRRQYDASLRSRRKVAELIHERSLAAWMELAKREDVPAEPILSVAEAREHPQALERAVLAPGPERLPRLGFPARFDGERPRAGDAVPKLGEQTQAVLAELGLPGGKGVGKRFSLKRWLRAVFR